MNLKDTTVSTAPTLALHTCAPTPGIFTQVSGIELGSLCLYNKHFTDGDISPAFYLILYLSEQRPEGIAYL